MLTTVVKTLTDDIHRIRSESIIMNNDLVTSVNETVVRDVNEHVSNKFEIIDRRVDRIHQRIGDIEKHRSNIEAPYQINSKKPANVVAKETDLPMETYAKAASTETEDPKETNAKKTKFCSK